MKCPNCGCEIPAGKMYCEGCGAELQIVPDIELDIEKEMNKTMSDIALSEFADEYDMDFDDDPNLISMVLNRQKSGKAFYIILGVIIVLIIAAAIILGTKISSQNNYEYQIQLADEKVSDNNLIGAISCLEAAYKIKPEADILFKIADYYYTLGRDNDAIYTLKEVIAGEFPEIEKESAYKKIITLYVSSESYSLVADLLQECTNKNILEDYADFLVYTPEFNVKDGTYDETMTVKLSVEGGTGNIYYTLDGSTPNTNSELFSTPIFMEYGTYNISAVYINKYGVSSEVVKAKYTIDVEFVFEPDILTESGTYTEATLIEADVPVLYTLYYTTDGTDPSKESTRYVAPIPMKEGENTYKFVCYASDGTMSSIVEKKYVLQLEAAYTPAEAVTALSTYLISVGYVNSDGQTKPGVDGIVQFMYSAIYPIEGQGNFYFVVEYIKDPLGNLTNTNTIYAIGCSDLSINRVISMGNGEYSIAPY